MDPVSTRICGLDKMRELRTFSISPFGFIGEKDTMKSKVHLVIPEGILAEVDRIAGERRRSLFITEATREKLERERFLKVLDETKGAWTDKDHPELKTDRNVEQYVREKRHPIRTKIKRITK